MLAVLIILAMESVSKTLLLLDSFSKNKSLRCRSFLSNWFTKRKPFARLFNICTIGGAVDSTSPLELGHELTEANIVNRAVPKLQHTLYTHHVRVICPPPPTPICIWPYLSSSLFRHLRARCLVKSITARQLHFQVGAPSRCGPSNYN